jgi:hypothetical protein
MIGSNVRNLPEQSEVASSISLQTSEYQSPVPLADADPPTLADADPSPDSAADRRA